MTKAIIAGETTAQGGRFINVKVNPSGTLQIEQPPIDEESDSANDSVTGTAEELRADSENMNDRRTLECTPLDGDLRWSRESANLTATQGHLLTEGTTGAWSVGSNEDIFVIAVSGTVAYHVTEGK